MRIQNRDRKSGKMCDQIRRTTGIILLIISIAICLAHLMPELPAEQKYRSSGRIRWSMDAISAEVNGPVRINEAEPEEMTCLPGIGDTIATMIAEERKKNGPFYYAADLESVRGIGPRTIERFREMINLSQNESEE